MDPSKDWGQNKGLQELKARKTGGNGKGSKREHYLSFLCNVFSQEDGFPKVREAYR